MLIKPNWDNFKAKFSENPQDNFEWFCYLLFSKEYHQPYGIHRYKKQSGIETDPIEVNGEVIGWQSKFYDIPKVATLNRDLKETLRKAKRDYPNITKIVFYTNMEWTKYHKNKNTKAEKVKAHKEIEELFEKEKIELVLRMDSYFESIFVCQEQREISRYFFERDTKWELTNNGFKDTLRYCYLKNFKTISLLDEKKKRVSDIFVNLAIIKERKEEKSKDKLLNRETFLSSYEEIHKPKEPIEIKELINTSKKSLIYGKAGVGKTTLCKYIAYKWAKGELYNKFEYVVYIPLRKWDSTQLKEVIRSHYYSQYKEEIDLDIKENSNKILFLFDGYDELKSDKRDGLHKAIRDNKLTNYIITTRPYGYQKSDFRVDEYFETIGFTDENVEKYIDAFFKENNDKAKSLKAYLKTNISIKHIGYIPLMLEMICLQWEQKEFSESLTMTELYTQSIENIFFEYTEKNGTAYIQDKEEEIFNYLGKIAFEGLKQQTIVLDKKIIKEKRSFFSDYVLKAGFLNDGKAEKSNPLLNSYQFPHLTFQEYFSALYVSKLPTKKQKKIISKYKFHPHFQIFFVFLGGLIKKKKVLLGQINGKPRDITIIYELNLLLMIVLEFQNDDSFEHFFDNLKNNIILFFKNKNFNDWSKGLIINMLLNLSQNSMIRNFLIELLRNKELDKKLNDISILKSKIIAYLPNYEINDLEKKLYWKKMQFFAERIRLTYDWGYFKHDIEVCEYGFAQIRVEEINNSYPIRKKEIQDFLTQLEGVIQGEEEFLDIKEYFSKSNIDIPSNLNKKNEDFIDFLLSIIMLKNDFWNRTTLYYLLSLKRYDKKIIKGIIDFIDNCMKPRVKIQSLNSFIFFINENFDAFHQVYITLESNMRYILWKLSIKTLFKAYDKKYDIFFYIKEHCQSNNKPLYINEENQLCTIENGKEISTQREVDEATLNEIKMMLRGDGLNG